MTKEQFWSNRWQELHKKLEELTKQKSECRYFSIEDIVENICETKMVEFEIELAEEFARENNIKLEKDGK